MQRLKQINAKKFFIFGLIITLLSVYLVINFAYKKIEIELSKNKQLSYTASPSTGVAEYYPVNNLKSQWMAMWEPQEANVCWAYATCKAMEACMYSNSGNVANLSEWDMINYVENWKSSVGIGVPGGKAEWAWNSYLRKGYGPATESESMYLGSVNVRTAFQVNQNITAVKDAIAEYGGLYASVAWTGNGAGYHTNYNGYNVLATMNGAESTHAICLLGWNDNFSKDNFPPSWGVSQNGAFWAYNPLGGQELWVSYQDPNICLDCWVFDTHAEAKQWSASNPGPRLSDPYWDPEDPNYGSYNPQPSNEIDGSTIVLTWPDGTVTKNLDTIHMKYTGEEIRPWISEPLYDTSGLQLHERGTASTEDFVVIYGAANGGKFDNKNARKRWNC